MNLKQRISLAWAVLTYRSHKLRSRLARELGRRTQWAPKQRESAIPRSTLKIPMPKGTVPPRPAQPLTPAIYVAESGQFDSEPQDQPVKYL